MSKEIKNTTSLNKLLFKLWFHLSRKRKKQLKILIIIMIISSIAEILSLASVVPFLNVLTNPEALWRINIIKEVASFFGLNNSSQLILPITIFFILAALLSGFIRIANIWLNGRLAAAIGSDLSCEAYRRSIYQKYKIHLNRNSSSLIASMSKDIDRLIMQVLNPILQFITAAFIILGIALTLFIINWAVALICGSIISFVYIFSSINSKKVLKNLGERNVFLHRKNVKHIQESLNSIRDIILHSMQPTYIKSFADAEKELRKTDSQEIFLTYYPRLLVEPIGLILISILAYIIFIFGETEIIIPTLGALALGFMRLLPMAHRIYEGITLPQYGKASLFNIIYLLEQPIDKSDLNKSYKPLQLNGKIEFRNVDFSYKKDSNAVLYNLNFSIKKGDRVGIIGETGSGKSTLMDLIMGLIIPKSGNILIDGKILHNRSNNLLQSWKSSIMHVPQNIYLIDSSIAENIAFGVSPEKIDFKKIKYAAKKAKIHEFVENLPEGYKTSVGENGVRLSGGQKQRIGIARALYNNVSILVLDEATSSLDAKTEHLIIDSIEKMNKEITIIMIAHRLTSLKNCNRILEVKKGEVVEKKSL